MPSASRRSFLQSATGAVFVAMGRPDALARVARADAAVAGRTPEDVAQDEDFWRQIQEAFTLDRTLTNLNNGGVCPSPRAVHEAMKRYLDISNQLPAYYMWQVLEPNLEAVRRRLAAEFGCDPEELAITRNASEALQIAQLGIDLNPGDEVVTTNQDYPRMLDTWQQRVRRDKIVLRQLSFSVPPRSHAELASIFDGAISARTKVLHFCHITNLTGQIFPVRDVCRMARARGIVTIVDGAHAFAHFPFTLADLDCDYYGTSLHKWLLAPVGTGFLYVRRERIKAHWPLTPANESKDNDIRKFEEIGTHPAAMHNAIAEALEFHHGIGGTRKAARLRYLRERWARKLDGRGRAKVLTSFDPAQACAIGLLSIEDCDPVALAAYLFKKRGIVATPIKHPEFEGLRVTPNVYTTLQEIDGFVNAIEEVLAHGLPTA
jgi:isopenicillin-N epimerase